MFHNNTLKEVNKRRKTRSKKNLCGWNLTENLYDGLVVLWLRN